MGGMGERSTNLMKSALVVVGALAFGYLSLEVAFKPFLEQARDAMEKSGPNPGLDGNGNGDEEAGADPLPADSIANDPAKILSSGE